jgi:hypothetical protein
MSNEKIIVAVHGVGDKIGYATAWSVAYQFWRYCEQPAAIPLGRFHTELAAGGARSVPRPILITSPPSGQQLPGLGSAEVYWADIPRTVVKEGYVLEEAKRWARTIVGRYCLRSDTRVSGKEVTRLETVLDEMIETVFVLERVTLRKAHEKRPMTELRPLTVDRVAASAAHQLRTRLVREVRAEPPRD